jgi:hypothetical protein
MVGLAEEGPLAMQNLEHTRFIKTSLLVLLSDVSCFSYVAQLDS